MSNRSDIIVGLDIGTTTVHMAVGQLNSEGRIDIIGVGTAPSRGLRKGVVINIEATVAAISKALAQAETMAGQEIRSVYAGISGTHLKGFNSHGIVPIKNREASAGDVERVIEAAKAVAIPMDREILHVLPQEFIIDEQDGIKEPVGISGVRLEARVHIISGTVASAQNVVKCANRCGMVVDDVISSGLAASQAVLGPEEQELGVCVLDIGGGTTNLVVYYGGAVKHTATLGIGGSYITSDVAAGLRTPIAAAEEIKCRYGDSGTSSGSEETIEVPSTGGREPRVLSRQFLSEIIEPRVQEILLMAQRELIRSGCYDYLASGIVLTGGGANLQGITRSAERAFNLPVRIGSPFNIGGLTDLVRIPEFATSVGLVRIGSNHLGTTRRKNRFAFSGILRRVGGWLGSHF